MVEGHGGEVHGSNKDIAETVGHKCAEQGNRTAGKSLHHVKTNIKH